MTRSNILSLAFTVAALAACTNGARANSFTDYARTSVECRPQTLLWAGTDRRDTIETAYEARQGEGACARTEFDAPKIRQVPAAVAPIELIET